MKVKQPKYIKIKAYANNLDKDIDIQSLALVINSYFKFVKELKKVIN